MWDQLLRARGWGLSIQFLWGVLSVMVAIAVTIYLLLLFGDQLTPVPLKVEAVRGGIPGKVCPGQEILTEYDASLTDALLVEIFYGIMDKDKRYVIIPVSDLTFDGSLDGHALASYDRATDIWQPIPWRVPDLPPGVYNFYIALWMRGIGADPVINYVEFEVGLCPR